MTGVQAHVGEGVGVEVRGGVQVAFDAVAVEVGDDHVLGAEIVVVDARGLDDDEALLAVDAACVAEGVEDEAAANEFKVGFEDFFAEGLEQHLASFLGGLAALKGLTEGVGGELGREVALWGAEEFEADHELANRGRAEKRWIEVCVEVPGGMVGAVGRLAVETHGVGE